MGEREGWEGGRERDRERKIESRNREFVRPYLPLRLSFVILNAFESAYSTRAYPF